MSVISFTGQEDKGGIPDGSKVRIEACYGKILKSKSGEFRVLNRELVYKGIVTGGQVNINLDPGLYLYKVHNNPEDGMEECHYGGDFYHECTPEQFKKITHMRPNMADAVMTSDGVSFRCKFPGCKKNTSSRVAALLHETKSHYGIDLLEEPERKDEADDEFKKQHQQVVAQKRGPGRPRKNPVGVN